MAGYIMTFSDYESMETCITTGVYSTRMSEPKKGFWNTAIEGTFADYLSMKQGDSIFFFQDRRIYGIGKIINVAFDCKYLNYVDSDIPEKVSQRDYRKKHPLMLDGTSENKCLCMFEPSPYFFKHGIDMDEALNSESHRFRALRTMWKVSFIKIDDDEEQALLDIILKRNEKNLQNGADSFDFSSNVHEEMQSRIEQAHRLSAYNILAKAQTDSGRIKHEMAIEASLCEILGKDGNTPFGKWDYVSHQVAASPFKPIDYMDKMDIFGYRYITGYKTISKYLVIEIKRGDAEDLVIDQVMKYVDWINQEYSHGDYSMIEAYVVAAAFPESVKKMKKEKCIRNYTKGYRPSEACVWKSVKLVRYEYVNGHINFTNE